MVGTLSGAIFEKSGRDLHIRVLRGKTLEFDVVYGGRTPIPLTGHSVILQARNASGGLMLSLSTENGGCVLDAAAGIMTFKASPQQTASVGRGVYEIEMRTPQGGVHRLASGRISPLEDIAQ
jgi:hypothetical protein